MRALQVLAVLGGSFLLATFLHSLIVLPRITEQAPPVACMEEWNNYADAVLTRVEQAPDQMPGAPERRARQRWYDCEVSQP